MNNTLPAPLSRYDSFSTEAKVVLVLAEQEAERGGRTDVGTEHLLAGLLLEGQGVAARALARLGVSIESVRAAVGDTPPRAAAAVPRGRSLTAGLDSTLDLAVSRADHTGSRTVDTEHLLLALVEGDDTGSRILARLGMDEAKVRAALTGVPAQPAHHYPPLSGHAVAPAPARPDATADLVARARAVAARRGEPAGAEHFLVAIAEEGAGPAAELLRRHGLDADAITSQLDAVQGPA